MSVTNPRYPLSWPEGWKRADRREPARFRLGTSTLVTLATGLRRLVDELGRLGARDVVISTDVPIRRDGMPYASASLPKDPGCAVYFTLKGRPHCLACDKYHRLPDNMAALAAHIDALRAIERYRVGTVEQAFAGYAQLPAPVADAIEWWHVLRVSRTATLAEIDSAYRHLAMEHHPDRGGSHEAMAKLSQARAAAHKAVKP